MKVKEEEMEKQVLEMSTTVTCLKLQNTINDKKHSSSVLWLGGGIGIM